MTRTPDRASELLGLLRERGAQPVLVPVKEAEPVTGRQRQDLLELLETAAQGPRLAAPLGSSTEGSSAKLPSAQLPSTKGRSPAPAAGSHGAPDRAKPLWLVATSANTVRALHRLALETHECGLGDLLGPGIERGLRVAAVGPATAAELESHAVPVHLQPHRTASAAGLLETWAHPQEPGSLVSEPEPAAAHSETEQVTPAPPRPGTVLLPQSAAASPELTRGLQELGWQVRRRDAYRMAPWPAEDPLVAAPAAQHDTVRTVEQACSELAAGTVDGVILTAPSAVRALADGLVQAFSTALAVIGQPTHTAVVALGLEAVVAESTAPSGLVEALERAVAAPPGLQRPAPEDIALSAQEE
ncbi:uroporphyrinogen-III synthase [Kocuria sp. p3-SID1433]|uniref:uroporphyrinogen-III synthase n=1 Tax=unclassified Kocuria TaxID=2649579 RepID=UPI0021A333E5|nr:MULTISPECIES: uroporphyrinogen-III synthase [unclassified Kocuria]MCT1601536.1 uroporphyrinogen-III synthase [Kocuria sp. p3-SID1428]MCT2179703.1 uroporphyrinogen-III synthase [Kocuria sp. p3-SID1433]